MVAGLSLTEELALAVQENRRYRAAMQIALEGLQEANDRGFHCASEIISNIERALDASRPATPVPASPTAALLESLRAWLSGWQRAAPHPR
jgi:hypothetical protein